MPGPQPAAPRRPAASPPRDHLPDGRPRKPSAGETVGAALGMVTQPVVGMVNSVGQGFNKLIGGEQQQQQQHPPPRHGGA